MEGIVSRDVIPASRQPGLIDRSTSRSTQIEAATDIEAVGEWLEEFSESPRTLEAYRRESERFLFWCNHEGRSLRSLTRTDVKKYESLLTSPPPTWISKTKWPRSDPRWRPFAGKISSSSIHYAKGVIRSLLGWLQAAGYASTNPFVLERARKKKTKKITRYLSRQEIGLVLEATHIHAQDDSRHIESLRARSLILLYYDSALRLHEPISSDCENLVKNNHGTWLTITGKGGIQATVPISVRALSAIEDFRNLVGLPMKGPLIPSLRAKGFLGPERYRMSSSGVGIALTKAFHEAADLAESRGMADEANRLRIATPHWLRHSRISHLINSGENIQTVRALARHSNIGTTGIYSHSEESDLGVLVEKF